MPYIKISLGLFIISLSLFLIAFNSEGHFRELIFLGMTVNFIGVAVLLVGAIKLRKKGK